MIEIITDIYWFIHFNLPLIFVIVIAIKKVINHFGKK